MSWPLWKPSPRKRDAGRGARPAPAPTEPPEEYVLAGRTFVVATNTTARHDDHMLRLIKRAGISELVMRHDEEPTAFVLRVIDELFSSMEIYHLLGTLLVEKGSDPKDWRPEHVPPLAEFLGGLQGEDKQFLRAAVLRMIELFRRRGIVAFYVSQRSRPLGGAGAPTSPMPPTASPSTSALVPGGP